MPILDMEHIGRADPQDKPLDMVSRCACGCRERIHFGDEGIWEYDGDMFASAECFARWYGARRMDGAWS